MVIILDIMALWHCSDSGRAGRSVCGRASFPLGCFSSSRFLVVFWMMSPFHWFLFVWDHPWQVFLHLCPWRWHIVLPLLALEHEYLPDCLVDWKMSLNTYAFLKKSGDIPWICFEHVAFGGVGTVRLCMLWEQCVLGWRLLQKLGKACSIQSCACFFLWEQGKFSASSHIGCWYLLAEDGTAYIPHVKSSWVFSSLFSSSLSRVWLCSFVGIEP